MDERRKTNIEIYWQGAAEGASIFARWQSQAAGPQTFLLASSKTGKGFRHQNPHTLKDFKMTEPLNSKQAECLRPHTEPGGIIYAWLKGDDMKFNFILYCQGNPVDLEIEDAQGNWDMDTFKRHVGA